MHKTILLITLLFVCFTSAHSLTDIEKKYYDNLEKQNQKLTEQVESQQKEINDLKLKQSSLENLVVNEPARLDKRIDDAKDIFNTKLDFATYIIGALGLFITVSGLIFGFLGININKTNKAIVFKQKEYDEKLKTLHLKADSIDQRLETQKEKLPAADKDIKSYTPEDLDNLEEYVQLLRREKAEKDYNAEEWFYLGLYYSNQGKHIKAVEVYYKSLKIEPFALSSWCNLGDAYTQLGNYREAFKAYRSALKIDPETSSAWIGIASILDTKAKYKSAVTAYEKAISLDNTDYYALNGLSWSLMQWGKLEESLKIINKCLKIKKDFFAALDTKANILLRKHDYDKALASINKALSNTPSGFTQKDEIEETKKQILEAIAERDKKKVEEENKDV